MPARDWKRCDAVRKKITRAGTVIYEVRDRYTNRQKKTTGSRSFPTYEEAEQYRIAHNERLSNRDRITMAAHDDAHALEMAAASKRLALKGIDPLTALRDAEKHAKPAKGNLNVREVYKEFLAKWPRVKTWAKEYRELFERVIAILHKLSGSDNFNSITAEKIENGFNKYDWGDSTRLGYETKVITLWTWAYKQGFTTHPVHEQFEKTIVDPSTHKVRIHSPYVVQALLNCGADTKNWAMVFSLVLTLFMGFRRSETSRFTWDNFRWEDNDIMLDRSLTKNKRRMRLNEMTACTRKWFMLCKENGLKLPLSTHTLRNKWSDLKEAFRKLDPTFEYTRNTNRHSCCAYLLSKGYTSQQVAKIMGNSPDIVESRYKGLVSKRKTKVFWEIQPDSKYDGIIVAAEEQVETHESTLTAHEIPAALAALRQHEVKGETKKADELRNEIKKWRDPKSGQSAWEKFYRHPLNPDVIMGFDGTTPTRVFEFAKRFGLPPMSE